MPWGSLLAYNSPKMFACRYTNLAVTRRHSEATPGKQENAILGNTVLRSLGQLFQIPYYPLRGFDTRQKRIGEAYASTVVTT